MLRLELAVLALKMSMAGEDAGGSFWATFGGGSTGTVEASPLEQLLQEPGCSVEALLGEEDVIQEFKACNDRLVARICEPDALKVLMEYITHEPAPDASVARCFRYPFVAVELISCAPPRFFESLMNPDRPEALDLLWSFPSSTPPREVNPVLAGYFSRTAGTLFSKCPTEVIEYLRKRGSDQLLSAFLERLHLRSLAELLARILHAEFASQVVFQTTDLVPRLLDRWQDDDAGNDAQENIALIIVELLYQKDSLCWIEDLTNQLTTPATVSFLVDHIFSQQPSGVSAATTLLNNVIRHTTSGSKDGMSVCASTPTLSPLSSPAPNLTGEDDMVNIGLDEPAIGEASQVRASQNSPPYSPTATRGNNSEEWLERRKVSLTRELASHFPRLRQLLDSSLNESLSLAMPQGTICAVGSSTFEVVDLISTLSRTGLDVILEAVLNNELLPRCIEVFFRHPWSNLLHNSVKALLSEVLSGFDSLRPELVHQLLREARFADRVVEEYSEEARLKSSDVRQKHARVGYMGHLFLMACELREFASKCPEVGNILSSTQGWEETVLPALEALRQIHGEQLGGGISDGDRGLASSNVETPSQNDFASTGLDLDFVLHDPPDLDEEDQVDGNFNAGQNSPEGAKDRRSYHDDDDDSDEDEFGYRPPRRQEDAFDPDSFGSASTGSVESGSFASAGSGWADFSDPPAAPVMNGVVPFADFSDTPSPAAPNGASPPWPKASEQPLPIAPKTPPSSWVAAFDNKPKEESEAEAGSFWGFSETSAASAEAVVEATQDPCQSKGSASSETPKAPDAKEQIARETIPASNPAAGPCPAQLPVSSQGNAASSMLPASSQGNATSSTLPAASQGNAFSSTSSSKTAAAPPSQPKEIPQDTAPAVSLSESLGAENIFALIGEGFASSTKPPKKQTAPTPAATEVAPKLSTLGSGPQWPLPPAAAAAAPPPPWCAAPQASGGIAPVSSAAWPASTAGQLGATGAAWPAPTAGQPGAAQRNDRSWMADFDPLAGGSYGIASSFPSNEQPAPTGSGDLAFLDLQWQPSQQRSP